MRYVVFTNFAVIKYTILASLPYKRLFNKQFSIPLKIVLDEKDIQYRGGG